MALLRLITIQYFNRLTALIYIYIAQGRTGCCITLTPVNRANIEWTFLCSDADSPVFPPLVCAAVVSSSTRRTGSSGCTTAGRSSRVARTGSQSPCRSSRIWSTGDQWPPTSPPVVFYKRKEASLNHVVQLYLYSP